MTREIEERYIKIFDSIRKDVINEFSNKNLFTFEKKDNSVKLWLILKINGTNDGINIYYSQSKSTKAPGFRCHFVPDINVLGKHSERKKRFNQFAERKQFINRLANALNVSRNQITLSKPHCWKGFSYSKECNLSEWESESYQEELKEISIQFVKSVLPLVNEWYEEEGSGTIAIERLD